MKTKEYSCIVSQMEMDELRYFLSAAKHENIQRAAEELHISAGSVSKAVARLEDSLGQKLFFRVGRTVQITEHGRILQRRATQILMLATEARREIQGHAEKASVIIAGPEVFLAHFGVELAVRLRKSVSDLNVSFQCVNSEEEALIQVQRGEATFALTTMESAHGLKMKVLGQSSFKTCVGKGHPLSERALSGEAIAVEDLLSYPFVCPESGILGRLEGRASTDGWRDDKFPRKIEVIAPTLSILERILSNGHAVAYLPDFCLKVLNLTALKVTGCPYSCQQKIKLAADNELMPAIARALF